MSWGEGGRKGEWVGSTRQLSQGERRALRARAAAIIPPHLANGLTRADKHCSSTAGAKMASDAAPQKRWISQKEKRPVSMSFFV